MSLSIIVPALNAAHSLPATMAALGTADDIVVVDGGSTDGTPEIARALGARAIAGTTGRGPQMIAGESMTQGAWLLFLHADTILETGWHDEVIEFMSNPVSSTRAATFRFALDDESPEARRLEMLVARRVKSFGLPYGDQGLLISRDFYRSLGGFRPWPLMEDVDFVRRIGRHRLTVFRTAARTSADRWRRDGWSRRSLRNIVCLTLYFLGIPPRLISKLYA